MWYGLQDTAKYNPELSDSTAELLQSTLQTLIYVTGALCALWYIAVNVSALQSEVVGISWVLLIVCAASVAAYQLLTRHLVIAQVIWLVGLTTAVFAAIAIFQRAEIAALLMLIPMVSSVTLGWAGGLGAEAVIAALVLVGSRSPVAAELWPGTIPMVLLGGAVAGALGWASTRALLTVNSWALYSFQRAREETEEAREQRLELKQVQEDLLLSNRELARLSDRLRTMQHITEDARRAKEEFVANVSHELRTPLNMIIGFSEMIMQLPQVYGGNLPQALLADIAAIQRNSQHLSKLVDDVLDLSQIDAEQMTVSKAWVDIPDILEEACQAVSALYASKGLYLEQRFPETLPTVLCDATRIRQVAINLLSNAGRFTELGGVTVSAEQKDGHVIVSVSDTGPGIAPEDQRRLFQPFQQVDSSIRRRHGGSGLGLAISKRFIEMHDGEIRLESDVGKGTTIAFSLPLEAPMPVMGAQGNSAERWFHPYDAHTYTERTRRSKAPVPARIPRFMLVDQTDTLQRLFQHHAPDAETVAVRTLPEAIAALDRMPAQALVMNTPPLKELITELQDLETLPYDTPAISCWVPSGDDAFEHLGATDYLIKPVTRERLLGTLTTAGEAIQTVLIVDDDPEVLRLFSRIIASSERGYRILQAPSGRRALSLMQERHPDIVLLDLVMPEMGGVDVLLEKQKNPTIRDIPVVILSSMDPRRPFKVGATLTVTCGGQATTQQLVSWVRGISSLLNAEEARPKTSAD